MSKHRPQQSSSGPSQYNDELDDLQDQLTSSKHKKDRTPQTRYGVFNRGNRTLNSVLKDIKQSMVQVKEQVTEEQKVSD